MMLKSISQDLLLLYMPHRTKDSTTHRDKNRRKIFYSGKKKRHTLNTQFMVNNRGIVIHKTSYKKGKRHDYDIYKKNHPVTLKEVINVFDLGYLAVEKDYPKQLYHYCYT